MDHFVTILREETDLNVREIEQLTDSSCNRAFALSEIYGDALARLLPIRFINLNARPLR